MQVKLTVNEIRRVGACTDGEGFLRALSGGKDTLTFDWGILPYAMLHATGNGGYLNWAQDKGLLPLLYLSGERLEWIHGSGLCIQHLSLESCELSNLRLTSGTIRAKAMYTTVKDSFFHDSTLMCDWYGNTFENVNFRGCSFSGYVHNCTFRNCVFDSTNLRLAQWWDCHFEDCSFDGADLDVADVSAEME